MPRSTPPKLSPYCLHHARRPSLVWRSREVRHELVVVILVPTWLKQALRYRKLHHRSSALISDGQPHLPQRRTFFAYRSSSNVYKALIFRSSAWGSLPLMGFASETAGRLGSRKSLPGAAWDSTFDASEGIFNRSTSWNWTVGRTRSLGHWDRMRA